MYFSFASKDKGSCNVSTCKFIRFPLNPYTFHALIRFLRPNSPINGRFSIFLYLFAIGASYDFAYLCQQSVLFYFQKTIYIRKYLMNKTI